MDSLPIRYEVPATSLQTGLGQGSPVFSGVGFGAGGRQEGGLGCNDINGAGRSLGVCVAHLHPSLHLHLVPRH